MLLIAQLMFGFAGLCWLVAAGSALMLSLNHRQEGRGLFWYAVNGYAFYMASNFADTGAVLHKRMMWSMAGFVVSGGLAAALMFLTVNAA